MAIFLNGNKIVDLVVMGLDPGKVYTKDEIDAKLAEFERKMQPITNNEINYVCIDGVRVFTTTGSIGMVDPFGKTFYSGSGTTNIGVGRKNVTISENNRIDYNEASGIANYTIFSEFKNAEVSAIINYK